MTYEELKEENELLKLKNIRLITELRRALYHGFNPAKRDLNPIDINIQHRIIETIESNNLILK